MGCGSTEAPPVIHSSRRATFEHPAAWSVHTEPGRNEGLFMDNFAVVGKKSERVYLTVYDAKVPFAPEDVAMLHLQDLPGELAGKPWTETGRAEVEATVSGQPRRGTAVHFTVDLDGTSAPYTVQAFTLKGSGRTASVVTQVADADRPGGQEGLERVLRSLVVRPKEP
jgi:hypothetical protein